MAGTSELPSLPWLPAGMRLLCLLGRWHQAGAAAAWCSLPDSWPPCSTCPNSCRLPQPCCQGTGGGRPPSPQPCLCPRPCCRQARPGLLSHSCASGGRGGWQLQGHDTGVGGECCFCQRKAKSGGFSALPAACVGYCPSAVLLSAPATADLAFDPFHHG